MSTAETLPELVVAEDTKIHLPEAKILVVVDCQNDFLHPKGTLKCPVNDCIPDDEVKQRLENINRLVEHFISKENHFVIFTRDWHPEQSMFFSDEPDFTHTWPAHCVQNTWGAEWYFSNWNDLIMKNPTKTAIINKGVDGLKEEYSAVENPKLLHTIGLFSRRINAILTKLYVAGVASEFCVYSTYWDLKGFENNTDVICDAVIPATNDIEFGDMVETKDIIGDKV